MYPNLVKELRVTVTIKSKEQLLGAWVRRIKNNTDITDFQPGGALVTLMEAMAQQVYQAQLSVLKVLEVAEVDNLTETRLDDMAESLKIPNGQGGVGRQSALQATGEVTISSSFKKISTKPYAGKPSPYAGSTVLYVQDASKMFEKTPLDGKIYIGRNTIDSFEGPISYSSITSTGTYWIINLIDPLTKDHPYTDEIVLAQGGDRTINAATVVQVPAYSDAPAIQFTTDATAILPDGEDSVTLPVTCSQFGVIGNVASGAITEFASIPFAGATVINTSPFVNGFDTESDASLRQRIKDYPNTLARGTIGAFNAALLSVTDVDTKKKITSVSVVRPLEQGEPTTVYIDDGTLLEPVFSGQDYELLLAKASGLEQSFKTAQSPITPAIMFAAQSSPYVLQAGMTITILIDNIPYVYTITPSNYKDITAATAYEVVRDLNSDAEGILDFRVVDNGKRIVGIDRTNAAEEIRVVAGSFQSALGFPTVSQRPIYLYKNGILQSFKGKTATISSNPFSNWLISGASLTNLSVVIDGVTVSVDDITNNDFLSKFGVSMAAATADNWREVLQGKIPGVTVIFQDNRFILTSNKENNSSSEIVITQGDWIGSRSIFSEILDERSSVGASKNYTFNRYTGDIRFTERLAQNDIIEIASLNTRAFVKSKTTSTGKYDTSNDYPGFGPAKFIVSVDDSAVTKVTGSVTSAVIQVAEIDQNALLVGLKDKLGNGLFINAEIGDYLYLTTVKEDDIAPLAGFSSVSDDAAGFYKIKKIIRGDSPLNSDTIFIEVSEHQLNYGFTLNDEYNASYKGSAVFKIFSSSSIPQEIILPSAEAVLVEEIVNSINSQIVGAKADRNSGQFFFLRTNTYLEGSFSILATFGKANNVVDVSASTNLQSHVGSSSSSDLNNGFPIVSEVMVPDLPETGKLFREYLKVEKNYTEITQTSNNPHARAAENITKYPVGHQELWLTGKLSGWTGRVYNNETTFPYEGFLRTDYLIKPIGAINTTPVSIDRYSNVSLRLQDLAITPHDNFVVEMDLNSADKTVTLPMYKKAIISSEQLIGVSGRGQKYQFTLKDPEDFNKEFFNVTSPFKNFDFNDFKLVGKSVGVYKLKSEGAGPDEAALVLRSTSFGGTNRIKFNVLYPQSPSQPDIKISHVNSYSSINEVVTSLNIEMPSEAVIPSTIFNTGTYRVVNTNYSNNLVDITLSTQADAITAFAKMESFPNYNMFFYARGESTSPDLSGAFGNNIQLIVQDSGKLGATAGPVTMVSQSTKKVTLDLYGTTPTAAELDQALNELGNTSTYLGSVSGTGNLSLVQNAYNFVAEKAAKIENPYFTLTFNQIDYSPRIRGAAGNSWSFQCVDTGGVGPASVSVDTVSKSIIVNLNGQEDFELASLEGLLDTVLPNAISVTGIFSVGGSPLYLSPSTSPVFFSGGVTTSNTVYTEGGVNATNGIFESGLYLVNNLLQISGTQSEVSMPIGVWPIVDKPSSAEITIRVPDYNGLSSAVSVGSVFNSTIYQIRSFPVFSKTIQDVANAINGYLPDSPVVTAQVLGSSETDFLSPVEGEIPRSTFINYTNTDTIPSNITRPSSVLTFHSFSCNRSAGASIYDYNPEDGYIKSVVQSEDGIYPNGPAVLGTSYSSVGEEVFLLPTNIPTFTRWANFSPASGFSVQSEVVVANKAQKTQIASKVRGTQGAVYVQSTLANDYRTAVLEAASAYNNSTYFPLLLSQAKQIPKDSLIKISNALTADLLRPFRAVSTGASITEANTANEKTWFRSGANIIYERTNDASGKIGRLYFLRNGQTASIAGISVTATEPLRQGNISIQANTPSAGLATITVSGQPLGQSLSARIGDMMYINPSNTNFPAEVVCPALEQGLVMSSSMYSNPYSLSGYPGYPVVQVNNLNEIIVIAPNITTSALDVPMTSETDIVFVPTVYVEKNIKTDYVAGPKGVEILGAAETEGTHSEKISNKYVYAVLKKISNGFSVLVVSNSSDNITGPTSSNDSLMLEECGVNTDDYVFLSGFGSGADGQYQLVAHDGKNTMILYNPTLPLSDILNDSESRANELGQAWWGKQVAVQDNDPLDYTVDPRSVRIVDSESVLPGSKIRIASAALGTTNWFSQQLVGVWSITKIGFYGPSDSICQFVEFEVPNGAPLNPELITIAPANQNGIGFIEKEPYVGFRLSQGWAIDPKNTENAQVYLVPAKSYQKVSNSLGTEIECLHKLGYETVPKTGTDGYKIFSGLIREAQRTLDGVSTSINRYPGIKSIGTDVSVLPPIPRAVSVTFRVRARDGLSINIIAGIVRSSVTTYIASLGIGQAVILSELTSIIQDIPGVVSVEVINTLPVSVDGKIPVADNEKAVVIDPSTTINVGQ